MQLYFIRSFGVIFIKDIPNNRENGHPIPYDSIVWPKIAIWIKHIIIGMDTRKNIPSLLKKN